MVGNSGPSVPFLLSHAISLSSCVLLMGRQLILATSNWERTELWPGHDGALQQSTVAWLDIF